MELKYDKALLALHPLGTSVTASLYNQMGTAKLKIHSVGLLYLSWSAWILGIVATLWSFLTSIQANRKALDRHDEGQHSETNYNSGLANALTGKLNWLSGVLLVVGVILAALFLSRRL